MSKPIPWPCPMFRSEPILTPDQPPVLVGFSVFGVDETTGKILTDLYPGHSSRPVHDNPDTAMQEYEQWQLSLLSTETKPVEKQRSTR